MKDLTKLRELIIEKVDLADVMVGYGFKFAFDPTHAQEVQFHCPFHGGHDTKPSARLYRESKDTWCWVCHKVRNVVDVVREKEGLGYVDAIKYIIGKWRIDTSSVPEGPNLAAAKRPENPSESRVDLIRLRGAILEKRDRLPVEKYAALVTAYYMTAFEQSLDKPVGEKIRKLEMKLGTL